MGCDLANVNTVTQFAITPFDELTTGELYQALQLRQQVFIVEQTCVYPDIDGNDEHSLHVLGWAETRLVAYCRLLPPGMSYPEWSIGRVATAETARGSGTGRALMERALNHLDTVVGAPAVRISAQQYLETFYTSLGFNTVSDMYLEDDIPHIEMLRPLPRKETVEGPACAHGSAALSLSEKPPETVHYYWRPGCPFCARLRRELDKLGVQTIDHNIWESPDDAATVRKHANGSETVPTVVIGSIGMVNPSAEDVFAHLAEHAPHLLAQR